MYLLQTESAGVTLIVVDNVYTNAQRKYVGANLGLLLLNAFPDADWRDNYKLYADYNGNPSAHTEMPMTGVADVLSYENIVEGTFAVINMPTSPIAAAFAVALFVSISAAILLKPKIPQPDADKGTSEDNDRNSLSDRSNKPRPFERVPDNYGTLWVTPDVIGSVFRVYEGGVLVDYGYYCIGRGEYEILRCEDGDTPAQNIAQMSVAVLGTARSFGTPFVRPQWHTGNDIASIVPKEVYQLASVGDVDLGLPRESSYEGGGVTVTNTGRILLPNKKTITVTAPPPEYPTDLYWLYVKGYITKTEEIDVVARDLFNVDDNVTLTGFNVPINASTDAVIDVLPLSMIKVVEPTDFVLGESNIVVIRGHRAIFKGKTVSLDGTYYAEHVGAISNRVLLLDTTKDVNGVYNRGQPSSDWELYKANPFEPIPSDPQPVELLSRNTANVHYAQGYFNPQGVMFFTYPTSFTSTIGVGSYINIAGHKVIINDTVISLNGTYRVAAKGSNYIDLDLTTTSGAFNYGSPSTDWLQLMANNAPSSISFGSTLYVITPNPDTVTTRSLDGEYTIIGVGNNYVDIKIPEEKANLWAGIGDVPAFVRNDVSVIVDDLKWRGDYIITRNVAGSIIALNFEAPRGLYIITSNNDQYSFEVKGFVNAYFYDSNDNQVGSQIEIFNLIGSAENKRPTGSTTYIKAPLNAAKAVLRVARTTQPADTTTPDFGGAGEEVVLRNILWMHDITYNGGDVTTVLARTAATPSATAVQNRRLNMLVSRILEKEDGTFAPTNNPADIFYAVTIDQYIGYRLGSEELDMVQIRAELQEAINYFGLPLEFGFSFTDADKSYEEIAETIAGACFCKVYRQGSLIRWRLERERDLPRILFTHRNTIPLTFKKNTAFGTVSDKDGVELTFFDATNKDSPKVITLPESGSINPTKQTLYGVRDEKVATLHAWRLYNKIMHQKNTYEIEALEEAELLLPDEYVVISNLASKDVYAGDVKSVNNLTLTISETVPTISSAADGWFVFIQHYDGNAESIPVVQGSGKSIILGHAPRLSLVLNPLQGIVTTVIITRADSKNVYHCSIQTSNLKKSSGKEMATWELVATDYTTNVYDHDFMYKGN